MTSELVYFIFPSCNGTCAHCWSSNHLLGRLKPIDWHEKLIKKLSSTLNYKFSEIKISGGEPFLNKDIGLFPELIHQHLNTNIPINIFTSGRTFVSWESSFWGIKHTYDSLTQQFKNFDNCSIQLSIDEFHIQSLSKFFGWDTIDEQINTQAYICNFIHACELIKSKNPLFLGPKLKIHCNQGRSKYHKDTLFQWFPTMWWQEYAILTEGLISCGRGKQLNNTIELTKDSPISHFLLPGVDFYVNPQTTRAITYKNDNEKTFLFLDDAPDKAILIEGWWNLTNRVAKYETITII